MVTHLPDCGEKIEKSSIGTGMGASTELGMFIRSSKSRSVLSRTRGG